MKKKLILLIVFCGMIFFFLVRFRYKILNNIVFLTLGGTKLQAEIADSEAEREQGLSDRENLCSNCGMLFVFDTPGVYSFWMRRMLFDIDILWLADNRVVDITYGAKAPVAEEFDVPKIIYQSKVPADKVLEVNSGWVERNGIRVGDEVLEVLGGKY